MILTGPEIKRQRELGNLVIDPFDESQLQPNSYDVRLDREIKKIEKPPEGEYLSLEEAYDYQIVNPIGGYFYFDPDYLYLGSTVETAVSTHFVPMLEGRSSIGRYGMSIHITAGFGDIGWGYVENKYAKSTYLCTDPTWTLEITCKYPLKVKAGYRVGQVYFLTPKGERQFYRGKYNNQRGPQESRAWEDNV